MRRSAKAAQVYTKQGPNLSYLSPFEAENEDMESVRITSNEVALMQYVEGMLACLLNRRARR